MLYINDYLSKVLLLFGNYNGVYKFGLKNIYKTVLQKCYTLANLDSIS